MPRLRRQRMTVGIEGMDPVEVEAINPDYLRAETEIPRLGLDADAKSAPMTYMTAVAWAACKRLKLYDPDLRTFLWTDCTDFEVVKDDDDPGVNEVPPTPTGPDTG